MGSDTIFFHFISMKGWFVLRVLSGRMSLAGDMVSDPIFSNRGPTVNGVIAEPAIVVCPVLS